MMGKFASNLPNLEQAFAMTVYWLNFDQPLNQNENSMLKSAFRQAADDTDLVFVAASHTNVVVMNDNKAFCMKLPDGQDSWIHMLLEEKEGLRFERPGLVIANLEDNEDGMGMNSMLDVIYASVGDDMKMRLG